MTPIRIMMTDGIMGLIVCDMDMSERSEGEFCSSR